MNTLGTALDQARQRIAAAEARSLLCHLLGCSAAWIEAHRDAALSAQQSEAFMSLVARRAAGEPIAYLSGRREFYGREFEVSPAVLIPRPETELLVEWLCRACHGGQAPRVLDLGTGSGCIAVSAALELPHALVTACDVSPVALEAARHNASRLQAKVHFVASDWFAALRGERFDFIVSNPPYIAEGDAHVAQGDLRFEPRGALVSGSDGLDAIRRIIAEASGYLAPGGCLMFEHGYDQAEAVRRLLSTGGYFDIEQHRDLAGILRLSGGRHTA